MNYTEITMNSNQLCDYVFCNNPNYERFTPRFWNEPEWSGGTSFLCLFNGNLKAGNVESGVPDPDKISIYRRDLKEAFYRKVGTVGYGVNQFIDYNIKNDTDYYYQLYAESRTEEAVMPFRTTLIHTFWDNWVLMSGDIEKIDIKDKDGNAFETEKRLMVDKIFLFAFDANGDSINANINAQMISNFTRYPKYQKSKHNFYTGTLSSLMGYEDSTGRYHDSVKMLESLRECVTDGKRKFIKDLRGHLWEVALTSFNASTRSKYLENPYDVQIGFTEIANADDLIMSSKGGDIVER